MGRRGSPEPTTQPQQMGVCTAKMSDHSSSPGNWIGGSVNVWSLSGSFRGMQGVLYLSSVSSVSFSEGGPEWWIRLMG